MRISIIGGTGGMGEGLALRWALNHDILIGSRDIEKAKNTASEYEKRAREYYKNINGSIKGGDNIEIAKDCDLLILSIPYEYTRDTCSRISKVVRDDTIILSPIVPMRKGKNGFEYIPMHDNVKSATEIVIENISKRERIVSTLHTISEVKLRDLDASLDCDVYIAGDNINNVKKISELLQEIKGLRPLYIGDLTLAYQIEVLTPMLLNVGIKNKIKHPALRII